ncbi:RNA methyltransferase [Sulfurovum sp.]|uniref:TrmH family RNA methyltransferase n=1 Tax=Sulfurovum sp. TaxID=1969726 RepID=UPI0025D1D291|nr:RNA methyltransferase [Sulfurovum sp.]
MNYIPINDINIPELKIYHQLRDHFFTADQSFVADSPKVVNLLLKTDIKVRSMLATPEYYAMHEHLIKEKNIPQLFVASKTLMQEIVGHKIHHNVMMHGTRPEPVPLNELGDTIIMLDEISSTQNIGSIARSAAALGVDSYLLPKKGPHPYSRRALRVSMGHISMLKTHLYDDIFETIKKLKKYGYRIYAAEVTPDSTPLGSIKVTDKWVLLMGHEGLGISQDILDLCDEVVTIEMLEGIKSFNVAVAASIIMYQFKR